MHQFTKLREKARNAYGARNGRSAASSTQVQAMLNALTHADLLLEELTVRGVAAPSADTPPPAHYRSAAKVWDISRNLRLGLDRVQHLSDVTR